MTARKMMFLTVCLGLLLFCCANTAQAQQAGENIEDEYTENEYIEDDSEDEYTENEYIEDDSEDDYIEEYYDAYLRDSGIDGMDDGLRDIENRYDLPGGVSFQDILKVLLEGRVDEAVSRATTGFCESMLSEFYENRRIILRIVLLIIVAAVFNNYSSILKISYIGEQGFYITYLMIAYFLIQSFTILFDMAGETIRCIKELMECMLPAFYLSLVMCSGITTSQMVNSMFLGMLAFVENILLVLVLPAIRIYFLIVVLNQIDAKDRFSRLATLIKQGIEFVLKSIVAAVIGLNVVKSMLVPVYENARYNVLQKGLAMLPGGASLTGLSSILIGAGVLIKNSVGIAVVLVLLAVTAVPIVKMFAVYLMYRIMLALVQPISDARILKGISSITDGTGILLRATATSIVLSILSVAIVILTTNVRLYSG